MKNDDRPAGGLTRPQQLGLLILAGVLVAAALLRVAGVL